ncbi:DUF4113 domain-containing protein [Pseudomonas sp. 910_21]
MVHLPTGRSIQHTALNIPISSNGLPCYVTICSHSRASTKLKGGLDEINQRWGRRTLRSASVPSNPDWGMRREMMSQSYTTRLDLMWKHAFEWEMFGRQDAGGW